MAFHEAWNCTPLPCFFFLPHSLLYSLSLTVRRSRLSSPLLLGACQQNFWVKNNRQIYLIGNPFTWWAATTGVFAYIAVRGLMILRAKRGFRDLHHRSFPFSSPGACLCVSFVLLVPLNPI